MLAKYFRMLFSLQVILGAVFIAAALFILTFVALYLTRPIPSAVPKQPTAHLSIISAPTSTSIPATEAPVLIPSPTSNIPPSPLPGMIGVSSFVQIFGTDGSGLNIRESPGLNTQIRFLAFDAEVFEIRDGPVVIDDITWWLLVTPVDESRNGWAASNYLSLVPNP